MSWLTKVGVGIAKGAAAISGADRFLPILKAVLPHGAQDELQAVEDALPKIAAEVERIQAIGEVLKLSNDQKLQAAAPLVAQIVLKSALFKGKRPKDAAKFTRGITSIASGMADVLDSFDSDEVE